MQNKKILVVDDQVDFQLSVQLILGDRYELIFASTGAEAMDLLKTTAVDLILLDVLLPDAHGFDFIRSIQALVGKLNTPIVFLTSKTDVADKVKGFSSGAADYIVKPFEPLEFKARVAAHLRAAHERSLNSGEFRKGRWLIDRPNRKCFTFDNNQNKTAMTLTPHEFDLLCYLFKNDGRILSRAEFMENVWNNNVHVLSRTVDRHISALRKKLDPKFETLESVHGEGYRFTIKPPELT